jgi:amino acid efflux transporter
MKGGELMLTRWRAIPLALGSVAGAGILVLPSAVLAEAKSVSLVVWVVAALACIPMLLMFQDMIAGASEDGDGIATFISAGLGRRAGGAIPSMFLFVVVVGLPAGAFVAGAYAARWSGREWLGTVVGVGILAVAIFVNILGASTSSKVQLIGSASLIALSVALVIIAFLNKTDPVEAIPSADQAGLVLPGVLLAFWAFVGFENLTFLTSHLKDPGRDFLFICFTALGLYCALAIALTLAVSVRTNARDVDPVAGLLQIASGLPGEAIIVGAAVLTGVVAMLINAVSWVWGVAHVVEQSARVARLPGWLAHRPGRAPSRALALISSLFAISSTALVSHPSWVVDALAASSGVFVLMYIMCIMAYLRLTGMTWRSASNALLLIVMAASMIESGWRSAYAIAVFAAAMLVSFRMGPTIDSP